LGDQQGLVDSRFRVDMAKRLNVSKRRRVRLRTLDMMWHLIESMEKQHMLFANYKGRKENVMNLAFHFNTQTDALDNIELAADMKKIVRV
jgi:hypothetical protein